MTEAEGAYWLALLCKAPLRRQTAKRIIHRWCVEEGRTLASLFDAGQAEVAQQLGLGAEVMAQVFAAQGWVADQAAMLHAQRAHGVELVLRSEAAYPEALLDSLPEERLPYFIFFAGDLALLTEPGQSILGAATPSTEAEGLTRALARTLVEDGYTLVGGYGRGVDRLALDEARNARGRAALVLPLGLDHCHALLDSMEADLRAGHVVALSPYAPEVPYSDALAEARLPLVAGLSEGLLLVSPELLPAQCGAVSEPLAAGKPVLIWGQGDEALLGPWLQAGARAFDDVESARRLVCEACGLAANPQARANPSADDGEAPVSFADAESAVETLGRTGRVPEALVRRLRETRWPGQG